MSSLDKITNNIIKDANDEAQRLLAEAESRADEADRKMQEELDAEVAEEVRRRSAEEARIRDRVRTGAEREARNMVLASKQEALDRVFVLAKKQLAEMSDNDYRKLVKEFLSHEKLDKNLVLEIPKRRNYFSDEIEVKKVDDLKNGFRLSREGVCDNYDFDDVVDSLRNTMDASVISLIDER